MALTKLPKNALGTGSVDASKIEDGTIQTAELSGTVTADKLNATLNLSSKTVTLPNTSVTSDMLANTTVANAKLSNSSITVRGTARNLGDTFTIGVDVDWQSKITSDGSTVTTMIAQRGYFVDNSSAAGIVKLPTSASIGDTIAIKDYAGNFGTNNLTIQRNSHNIQGVANDSLISTNRASLLLVYVDSTKGWIYTEESNVGDLGGTFIAATGGTVTTSGDFKIHTFTGDSNFVVSQVGNSVGSTTVDYLVIAGGGGGGIAASGISGGGGGAGGYRESFPNPATGGLSVSAQTYPITVGGGGSGGPSSSANGSNSVFSTITSAGGGKGGAGAAGGPVGGTGSNGGSGGGGGSNNSNPANPGPGGSGNTPPVSPPQGNNGGNGFSFQGHSFGSGAGGGAGAVGAGGGPGTGGDGGAGKTSSINGTPTARAGGGGGAGRQPLGGVGTKGCGGAGGGGDGGQANLDASSGPANFGGGGGGESSGSGFGGAGGSGIVIIRYKFQ